MKQAIRAGGKRIEYVPEPTVGPVGGSGISPNVTTDRTLVQGYDYGIKEQAARIAELETLLTGSVSERTWSNVIKANFALLDQNEVLQAQLAEADTVIDAIGRYAEDRAFHARGHLNTVNSGRIASDLQNILAEYQKKATS